MAAILQSKQSVPEVFINSAAALEVPGALPEACPDGSQELPAQLPLTRAARVFLVLILGIATAVLANTAAYWHSPDLIKFGAFLAISLVSAGARIRVPGVTAPLPL